MVLYIVQRKDDILHCNHCDFITAYSSSLKAHSDKHTCNMFQYIHCKFVITKLLLLAPWNFIQANILGICFSINIMIIKLLILINWKPILVNILVMICFSVKIVIINVYLNILVTWISILISILVIYFSVNIVIIKLFNLMNWKPILINILVINIENQRLDSYPRGQCSRGLTRKINYLNRKYSISSQYQWTL